MSRDNRFLFISDLQIPFESEHALKFCKAVQREFQIPNENIYNVGDECDLYHGSLHKKDPDAKITANQEFEIAKRKLREWYKAFPMMKLATSNHGMRWLRKAFDAEIPSQVIKGYRELLDAPPGWLWRDRWNIDAGKAKIAMIHGLGYGGINAHRQAALDLGCNVVHGHLHSHAGISYINTDSRSIWGMNTGCLIDVESFAFKYGKWNRNKPVLGVGVVLDSGVSPHFIPYESYL